MSGGSSSGSPSTWSTFLGIILWLGGTALAMAACGGGSAAASAAPGDHVIGGDLLLVMQPGEGIGEVADQLVAPYADPFGGAKQGTADHVAWFDRDLGPLHVVTFTAGRANPRGGEPESCVMFGGGAGCVLDPNEPTILGWGDGLGGFEADAYGGAGAAEAVFTTEAGHTVSVLTVGGFAHAEWPTGWGQPRTVDFYDPGGTLVATLEIQSES